MSETEETYIKYLKGSTKITENGRKYILTYARMCSQLEEITSGLEDPSGESMKRACVLYMEELSRFAKSHSGSFLNLAPPAEGNSQDEYETLTHKNQLGIVSVLPRIEQETKADFINTENVSSD